MGQKDEEMTAIVSIDEISEFNKTPTSPDNKTNTPPELFTEKECQLIADSCCTKKSVKPCIYSTITSFVTLLIFLAISIVPAYYAFEIYDPKDSFTIILVFMMFWLFVILELGILAVIGAILVFIPMYFVYVYKAFLLRSSPSVNNQ